MPEHAPQKPPKGLGVAGRRLWREMTLGLVYDEHELVLLRLAAEQADVLASLEELVATDGWTVEGSAGQPRLHPAVAEARAARQAVARLLAAIPTPDDDGASRTPQQRRATKAANTRWRNRGTAS